MSDPFAHPETGELLDTEADFQKALDEIEEKINPLWRLRWALRTARADRFNPALMPRPRSRSDTQEKVSRCPRCGERIPK